jgi:SAM-dependent methyltransferase
MPASLFDDMSDVYECLVDWPKRLRHEEPFYRRLFERYNVKSVVDVACGTGHHAAMFSSWDMRVAGADLSSGMIERARRQHSAELGIEWSVRGFDRPIENTDAFDAAICVGNSLALAPDEATVAASIRCMVDGVREQGLIVIHLLNLWRLPDGPCVWQKRVETQIEGENVLIVKGVHRSGSRGFVDLVVTSLDDQARWHSESVPLLGLEAELLGRCAEQAGVTSIEFFGGYDNQPYDRESSSDLILVTVK